MKIYLILFSFFLESCLLNPQAVMAADQTSLSAESSKPLSSTYIKGESVEIFFSIALPNPFDTTSIVIGVVDEFGKVISPTISQVIRSDGNATAKYVYTAPSNKLGYYEVRASLASGTLLSGQGTRGAGYITYAIVPDPSARKDYGDVATRFGMQGGFNAAVNVLPYLGVRYILGSNNWAAMEPDSPGQFVRDLFKAAAAGKRHPAKNGASENPIFNERVWATYHVSTLTSASLPIWAIKPGTSGSICKKFGALNDNGKLALENFARAQSRAFSIDYKSQSSNYYQITWEPASGWCFGGNASELVEFYSRTYNAIHQGDSKALVAGPTLFINQESTKQLKELFTAGLGNYIDALAIHPYVKSFPPEKNGLPTMLREQLDIAEGAAGKRLPFIGTEHGFKSVADGNLNKALGDVRSTLILLGEGASFVFGFYVADFWDGEDPAKSDGYGFYWNLNTRIKYGTNKLGPKVVVPAFAAMSYFLDGTTSKGLLPGLKGTQLGYRYIRGTENIDVIWDYQGTSKYQLPVNTIACDWMANCGDGSNREAIVTGAPLYLIQKKLD